MPDFLKLLRRLSFLVLLFTPACVKEELQTAGDYFFLRSQNADMPVWVNGNKTSNVFIIVLHGGPGGTTQEFPAFPAFQQLEQQYRVVYWDQRKAGVSQGNPARSTLLSVDQYVEDLDKLVALIQQKYNYPTLFLMGHSWGGALGVAYLLDPARQRKIKGWIEVDGAHNNQESIPRQWVTAYAQAAIARDERPEFWQYALDWIARNPVMNEQNIEHYSAYIAEAHGYIFNPASDSSSVNYNYNLLLLHSPLSLAAFFTGKKQSAGFIFDLDYTAQLPRITLPVLMVWGRHDGLVPIVLATEGLAAYGSPPPDKRLVVLEYSAHISLLEQPRSFANAVLRFIAQYK